MNTVEVVLLIVGFICLCISFFVGNRHRNNEDASGILEEGSREIWTPKEEAIIREQIETLLQEKREEVIAETTEYLNRKSNEKIMEFDEFSTQVLEKINHNHEEVVFMYNLLTEKEKSLKDNAFVKPVAVTEPNATKGKNAKSISSREDNEKKLTTAKEKLQGKPKTKTRAAEKKSQPQQTEETGDASDKIIQMYKQGKTVLEISKELNIGQGEVKLMIALYGGRN